MKHQAALTIANISFSFIEEDRHVKFLPQEALSLVAVLEASGYDVDFRDYQQVAESYEDPQDPANTARFFAGAQPLVVIWTPNDAMPVAILWAKYLKEMSPGHTIILAGYGPKQVAVPILRELPFIDGVIHGIPEIVLPKLLDNMDDWASVRGFAFREGNNVRFIPNGNHLVSLDELPLPAYHKVDLNKYWEVSLFSSYGCPFRCSFCVRSGTLVEKSIDKIMEELSILHHEYGQQRVFFYDQTFTLKKKRVSDLCHQLRSNGLSGMKWSCTGRLNTVHEDDMKEMADSGCEMIYFGVESGSDAILNRIKKAITRETAEKVISQAQRFFSVNTFFIWGFPFETLDDFRCTIDMILSLKVQGVAPILYVLSPFPSSQIYRETDDNLTFSRELWEANWPVHLNNPSSRDQVAQFIETHPSIFPGFYTCDPYISKKLRVIQDLQLETHFPDV